MQFFSGGEKAMSLPPSISFGKIYACGYNSTIYPDTDGYTTTIYPGVWNDAKEDYDLPDDCLDLKQGELPFRLFVMIIALVSQLLVTELTHYLFVSSRKVDLSKDFLNCYVEGYVILFASLTSRSKTQ